MPLVLGGYLSVLCPDTFDGSVKRRNIPDAIVTELKKSSEQVEQDLKRLTPLGSSSRIKLKIKGYQTVRG